MTPAEEIFYQIISELTIGSEGKMFGAKCIKAENGKTVAFLWQEKMVFKLPEETQHEVLALKGAKIGTHIYAPDKPMIGWVSIPLTHSAKWMRFTKASLKYVLSLK
jgi:hypothetical protein